ncbi:MAG: hypothetical protein V4726_10175 [Verrucomicrobiota bacterium]
MTDNQAVNIISQRLLAYTVAIDAPGCGGQRTLAKLLVSSLLRTGWPGEILLFHNGEEPIFRTPRGGLEEVALDLESPGGEAGALLAWKHKYLVAERISAERYDRILFLDADCLVLRDLSHLLEGYWDISVQPERTMTRWNHYSYLTEVELASPTMASRNGINSGTWAVRGTVFHEVMAEWRRIDESPPLRECRCRDQSSWNRLLLDNEMTGRWKVQEWPEGEIAFPLYLHTRYQDYIRAALTHQLGGETTEKLRFTFSLWFGNFIYEDSCLFFQFMEA